MVSIYILQPILYHSFFLMSYSIHFCSISCTFLAAFLSYDPTCSSKLYIYVFGKKYVFVYVIFTFPNSCLYLINFNKRLLDSLVVECWQRVPEVPGSIFSQGPRHTKDIIKMVPVVPLFSTQHWKGKFWLFLKN